MLEKQKPKRLQRASTQPGTGASSITINTLVGSTLILSLYTKKYIVDDE